VNIVRPRGIQVPTWSSGALSIGTNSVGWMSAMTRDLQWVPVLWIWLSACSSGANSGGGGSSGADSDLGSYLTPYPDGSPAECTNCYVYFSSDARKASFPFNRKDPCPAESAVGACEQGGQDCRVDDRRTLDVQASQVTSVSTSSEQRKV
jgi:hypothetical protein